MHDCEEERLFESVTCPVSEAPLFLPLNHQNISEAEAGA